eukprot:12143407-Alexandrium_andersonii.AAC.1
MCIRDRGLDHASGRDFSLWSGRSAGAVFCDRVFLLGSWRSGGAVLCAVDARFGACARKAR